MQATDYIVRKIEIHRDRYEGAESPVFDITRAVAEWNFYESIYTPYITGSIAIVDSSALASLINFQGQEVIVFEFQVGDQVITKEFVIWSIPTTIKSLSDSTSSYTLEFIEKRGYTGAFRRLRGSYSGKIEEILGQIFEEEIDVREESDQMIKVLGVNRNPIELSLWLSDRATSDIGEPMFFFSTLNSGLKFTSLGEMFSNEPLPEVIFRYTQVPYGPVEGRFKHEASVIHSIGIPEQDNIMDIAKSGAARSRFFNIDTFTRNIDHVDFLASEYFEAKKESNKTLYNQTLFDSNFSIDGEVISNAESRYVAQVNTSQMYSGINAYDEDTLFAQRHKLSRYSDLILLNRERFDIIIPGFHGLGQDFHTTVGTVINVSVPKDQPVFSETDISRIEDKKRSGKFLVTNARHIFDVDGNYRVAMSLARTDIPDNSLGYRSC